MNNNDVEKFSKSLKDCDICPRECHVNRFNSYDGICGMSEELKIASYGPHYGEEPELIGYSASGTIFFSGCNLLCEFCQNFDISHFRNGTNISTKKLKSIMLQLQNSGVCNINLVTPTHFAPQIIKSIIEAKKEGLTLPIVYNSSGYDKVESLNYFEGLVDIYMPDFKFYDPIKSNMYCSAPDYFEFASKAIKEMYRQVGDLQIIDGIAKRGLLIRHLILPGNQSDTNKIIDYIADTFGANTYLNLMDQYHPDYNSSKFSMINTRLNKQEYEECINYAKKKGFHRPDYIFEV